MASGMSIVQRINGASRRLPPGALYVLAPLPAVWWFYQGVVGGLGPEPVKALEHLCGELALQLLILCLAVTPLRMFTGLNLIRFRRAIGVIAFFYVLLHLCVWLFIDVRIPSQIWADILKRPYITIGMVGFALLVPLAVTSNNLSVRRLGSLRWRRLHRLVYVAVLLGGVHFLMVVKGWQVEPMVYLGVIAILLAARFAPRSWRV